MRQLATIQKIEEVLPIEGADAIEKVRVKDWWCVAKKNEFRQDDLCVYFEIDSLLPSSNPLFSFLAKGTKEKTMDVDGKEYKGYRLKTIRLRGQLSQGLALPLATVISPFRSDVQPLVGTDVSAILEIVKYEPPIPANLAGQVKGFFPGFLRKTDEERLQNCGHILAKHQGKKFYVTEKLDGSSCTYYKKSGEFGACSRNLDLKDTEGNTHWTLAKQMGLLEKLPDNFAIQGELVGNGIQGNPLKINGHRFYAFNVFDIIRGEFLGYYDMIDFCQKLGVDTVPVLTTQFELLPTVEEMLKYAEGKSALADVLREGVVIRPLNEETEEINGSTSRFSFKVISNEYLLKYEE